MASCRYTYDAANQLTAHRITGYFLTGVIAPAQTVFDDNDWDELTGSAANDWLIPDAGRP